LFSNLLKTERSVWFWTVTSSSYVRQNSDMEPRTSR